MSLQEFITKKFTSWKPQPPRVEGRTKRDVILAFNAEPFSFLGDQLLYRVERKEKIPPWVVVYSGGKTTKTIDNLAPSHPHKFRLKVIVKSSGVSTLADTALRKFGDERTVYKKLNEVDESKDQKQNKENDSSEVDEIHSVSSHTMGAEGTVLFRGFEEKKDIEKSEPINSRWLESQWSEETWTSTDSDGTSSVCFCMAVRCGYLKQVQQMLEERPALISVVNCHSGSTALDTAVRKGEVGMVRYLLSAGAEVDQPSSTGQTPLHMAVLGGHIAIAELLLEKGANFQARDINQLRTEHYAVDSSRVEVVQFVFDRGGDISVQDSKGWTPLFRAVCQGAKTELIEELVNRGSDVNSTDRAGLSIAAAARVLKDRHGRRRESVLRLVDSQFQYEKAVANFTRLTKKISSVHTLLSIK